MYTDTICFDGEKYKMIDDTFVTQKGTPAEAYCAWHCVKHDDVPDQDGCLTLYEARYTIPEEEEESDLNWWDRIDWDAPDEVVDTGYEWMESEWKMV